MQTTIEQTFTIDAPVEAVWAFLLDPHRVAECMPGASLESVEEDGSFRGSIALKLGFVSVGYEMQARFAHVDETARTARIEAAGRESGQGEGEARGILSSRARALPDGGTEVTVEVEMVLAGRLVEFGKGMIRSVSRQLTKRFVARARELLETV